MTTLASQRIKLKSFQEEIADFPRHPLRFLWRSLSLPGLVARQELLGFRLKRDVELIEKLRNGIFNSQFPRGSWKGSVGWTAHRLEELSHLSIPSSHPAVQKALAWILNHQTKDGNFCERPRIPLLYPCSTGDEFSTDNYALSFTAYVLKGLTPWIPHSEPVERAVRWLACRYEQGGACCLHCATHVLAALGECEDQVSVYLTQQLTQWLAQRQEESGLWLCSLGYIFVVLHGLGFVNPNNTTATNLVRQLIPLLAALQYSDGGWGRLGRAEKSLVVARALTKHGLISEFCQFVREHPNVGRQVDSIYERPPALEPTSMTV